MQFKVGDEVRVKTSVEVPYHRWGSVTDPKSVGVVTGRDGDGDLIISFPEQSRWYGVDREMELVKAAKAEAKTSGEVAAKKAPRAYAVTKGSEVLAVYRTREEAREHKSWRGGKAAGVQIIQMTGSKEIR